MLPSSLLGESLFPEIFLCFSESYNHACLFCGVADGKSKTLRSGADVNRVGDGFMVTI